MPTKGQRTRQEIVEKSLQLFSVKGYYNTSVNDILETTGLTKGGLYGHFRSKEEIWQAAYKRAVEIWQGTFSPGGKKRILIMPGIQAPLKIKAVYAKAEVYPLAFNFYVSKADALMEVPGMPDFVGIKSYLNRAFFFATTPGHRQTAEARINQIDRMILFYKADVAAAKGTRAGLEAALGYLDQVAELNPDDIEAELIKKKKASIRELLEVVSKSQIRFKGPATRDYISDHNRLRYASSGPAN